ncbi:hypothetical protein [Streptomyces lydicus]|uniref:hypothetical protein n=1 Tax=Streptomyces lydicus TaxID=47763 RepID=UPI0037F39D3A
MRIDRDPALIAYQAADECRALVAATTKPAAYPDTAVVRAVIEGLHLACRQLPVAVGQASAGVRVLEEQGVCGDASAALRALLNAREALVVAREELRTAEAATARLGVQ